MNYSKHREVSISSATPFPQVEKCETYKDPAYQAMIIIASFRLAIINPGSVKLAYLQVFYSKYENLCFNQSFLYERIAAKRLLKAKWQFLQGKPKGDEELFFSAFMNRRRALINFYV